MTSPATSYAAADRPLTALLDTVPPTGWSRPSPCDGWTAADVVGHLIGTQRHFLGTHGVDLGEAPDVAADPALAWRRHAERVTRVASDETVAAREFDGHFGRTTVGAALVQFYVWDMVVHRWDVARAVGADAGLTDEELDRIETGADGFGPALHMDGVCRPALDVPADADRRTRALARLGRSA
ncbi:maleylpyruvate isomerase family mycothiol-dependent enzyme [Modestobacter marinus]|uniref:Uncharacterized protein (TIGR03086 family) n=1 Tax=Modestobacter marinus TaxID=477641 RepID=A0A846LVQ2_9ACTN|nr:TIGR03086 family metal-binding protein [Modestobacter marinus]NIH69578.1 uncharacterized protein (TIGR03086 family) [Modestobacter marinus]GGL74972.1 hypothetical protein GCM10011589_33790 [Modestobacter marinus]